MTALAPHYHVGIVVADLAAARTEFSELLGVTWGPVLHLAQVEYRDQAGEDVILPTTFCYSVEEPRLELIEEVPGSVWVCNEHSNLHHIGFWSDDLPAESSRLAGAGCPLQFCGRAGDDAPVSFAYHRNESGVRFEVVAAEMRPAMESFLFLPDES
jgi:catechol 2,3-dioxygenase-like lactoylglutathione lyase family enzyme